MLTEDDVEITLFVFREFHEKLTAMSLCSSEHFDLVSKISQKVFKPEPWYTDWDRGRDHLIKF